MTYLNYPEPELSRKGALYTAREIAGQPDLWVATAEKFVQELEGLRNFLTTAYKEIDSIILTGAGTSAFIGLSLQGCFFTQTGIATRAVATTDIVSHPQHFFDGVRKPLILSFARSGNSPESCAALELADRLSSKCFHLIVTCNGEGMLAKYQSNHPCHVFVLPPGSNDESLAMTGSYSSMLLAGLLTAYMDQPGFCRTQVAHAVAAARQVLTSDLRKIRSIADLGFERAVFLGSGPLFGTATEAALKLQELTDGKVICKADSYLGFRHGPKAVIDEKTLVVYLFSNNDYVRPYEQDLLQSMKMGNAALFQLGIGVSIPPAEELGAQITLGTGAGTDGQEIAEDFLPLCSIVPGQLLGFFKSLQVGLGPDSPSISGAISRVVEGVNIYLEQGLPNLKK